MCIEANWGAERVACVFAPLVLHRHMLLRRAAILSGALIGADGFGPEAATGQVRASNKLRITAGMKRVRAAYK